MSEFTAAPVKPAVGMEALEVLDIRVGSIERIEEVPRSESGTRTELRPSWLYRSGPCQTALALGEIHREAAGKNFRSQVVTGNRIRSARRRAGAPTG